jgi:probable biosynthetic protein (TIGR04098 family)
VSAAERVALAAADGEAVRLARSASEPLPAVPLRLRIGMPQLDAGGLSEGWLFRYAGDLQWEAISRHLGVASDEIREEGRQRLYPTVVALRARYDAPLAGVDENDVFDARIEVVPCGGACAHGRITAVAGGVRLAIELLTTFARRAFDGKLATALPAARLAARWAAPPGVPAPRLGDLARAARRGQPVDDAFCGPSLDPPGGPLGRVHHEPSPYADYNGARLLYFAAYPTIADTAERRLVRSLGLHPAAGAGADWAIAASPVQRDVFYYANLPLGEALIAELLAFEKESAAQGPARAGAVKTRVRLRRERDGERIADIITRRQLVERPA